MNNLRILFLLVLLVATSDWPQFRGPTGQGVSDEQGLPLTWSENNKCSLEGRDSGKGLVVAGGPG